MSSRPNEIPGLTPPLRRFPPISFTASVRVRGDTMLGSGIINVAIGLAFIFGVTAALSSVFTEMIARFLGLRGAYLLRGLRELLDSDAMETDLTKAEGDYTAWQEIMKGNSAKAVAADGTGAAAGETTTAQTAAGDATDAENLAKVPSATGALLGSP